MATVNSIISRGSKNRLTFTEAIDDASWAKSGTGTTTANSTGTLDPNGGNTAELVDDTSAAAVYTISKNVLSTDAYMLSGNLYTFSIYAKKNTATKSRFILRHVTGGMDVLAEVDWNLVTVTKITTGSPGYANVDLRSVATGGGGWYRVSCTIRYNGTGNFTCIFAPANDGTSTLTGSIWVWGAQFEEGQYATEYKAITGSTDPLVGTYTTIAAWITATNASTVDINVGQLRDEEYPVTSGQIVFAGSGGTSTTNYRRLTALSTTYNPVSNTGPRIVGTFATSGTNALIKIQNENRVTIDNIGIFASYQNRQGAGDYRLIWIDRADDCRIWDCFLTAEQGLVTTTGIHIEGTSSGVLALRNNIFNTIIKGGDQRGLTTGIFWSSFTELGGAYNCLVYNCRSQGYINSGAASAANYPSIVNCLGIGNGTDISTQWKIARNNLTSDFSAISAGLEVPETGDQNPNPADPASKGGIAAASLWLAPNQNDFRLKPGSVAIDKGGRTVTTFVGGVSTVVNIETIFTGTGGPGTSNDFAGTSRATASLVWDVGPYEGTSLPISSIGLSGFVSVETTGATTAQNGIGDSEVRIEYASSAPQPGTLSVGDLLKFAGVANYTATVTEIAVFAPGDIKNVKITPVLPANLTDEQVITHTSLFSVVQKTIGKDPARDFCSVGAFVLALPRSLYWPNQKWIGLCYSDAVDEIGASITLDSFNCITSIDNNVEIKAVTNIDPRSKSGHQIKLNLDVDLNTSHRAVIWLTVPFTKISGLMLHQAATSASTKNARGIEIMASDCSLDAIFCLFDGTYSRTIGYNFDLEGDRLVVTNCVARGSNTTAQGASTGFNLVDASTQIQLLHNIAYRIKGGTSIHFVQAASGFNIRVGSYALRVSGCIAMETAGTGVSAQDFTFGSGLTADGTLDHCISADTTAGGAKSFISQTAANTFKNAASNDYRLTPGSVAINAGDNLLSLFSLDISGAPRISPFDIGVYEGIAAAPLLSSPHPKDHHRFASLWEIVRTDGVSHLFCSSNQPIDHGGQTYKPNGQAFASARRMEGALKEHNVEVLGAITSGDIEAVDLAAGVFTGARITERLIDWRYPWTVPYRIRVYRIAVIEYDQDYWKAELVGPTTVLEQRTGESIGIDCPYDLGDEDCQFRIDTVTQVNKTVTVVNDARREFTSTGLSGTGVTTDDYFGKGTITWILGANVGLTMEVKSYTQATKTLRLTFKAPYDIVAADRFNLKPGCRKRYVLDCITKFNNGINFGGRPLIPGTDESFKTPTR